MKVHVELLVVYVPFLLEPGTHPPLRKSIRESSRAATLQVLRSSYPLYNIKSLTLCAAKALQLQRDIWIYLLVVLYDAVGCCQLGMELQVVGTS